MVAKRRKRVHGKQTARLSESFRFLFLFQTHTVRRTLHWRVLPSRAYFMSWANSIHMTSALTLPTLSSWGNLRRHKKSGIRTRQTRQSVNIIGHVCAHDQSWDNISTHEISILNEAGHKHKHTIRQNSHWGFYKPLQLETNEDKLIMPFFEPVFYQLTALQQQV